jgi:hypothetical protein
MLNINNVGIHNLSPGMVTTDLLMAGALNNYPLYCHSFGFALNVPWGLGLMVKDRNCQGWGRISTSSTALHL